MKNTNLILIFRFSQVKELAPNIDSVYSLGILIAETMEARNTSKHV